MGREVRPVALDWEHPREPGAYSDGSPRYVPLHSRKDLLHRLEWRAKHPDDEDEQEPVNLNDYMPEIPEGTPYGWQLYETVTEGTPLSPVFAAKDELAAWMSDPARGRDWVPPDVAARFVAAGWAPSFVMSGQGCFMSGVEAVGTSWGDQA